jgi:lipopolysaccharide biosynthesis glycosyltransferase
MKISTNHSNVKNKFHIAFGINDAFAIGAGICIISILENNPEVSLEFHIFSLIELSAENREKMRSIVEKYDTNINLHLIEKHGFYSFKKMDIFLNGPYSLDILTRLLIPGLLAGVTNHVLYLDADVVCDGKIDPFLSLDLNGNVLAARVDGTPENEEKYGLKPNTYFNAGLLYIDINEWQRQNIFEKILNALETYTNIRLPDQDTLNIVLQDKTTYLPQNLHYHYFFDKPGNEIIERKIFIHYLGCIKPWHGKFSETVPFNRYWKISPWENYEHSWSSAKSLQLRVYARYLFRHKKILQSVIYFFKYLKIKSFAKK